jgi:hypothetical protein
MVTGPLEYIKANLDETPVGKDIYEPPLIFKNLFW